MNEDIEDIMVAVVGAGPAGSSAAEAVAASGVEVLLIDKKSEIGSPVQCGGFLPEAVELEKLMPRAHLPEALREIPERIILHRTQLQRIYSPSGKLQAICRSRPGLGSAGIRSLPRRPGGRRRSKSSSRDPRPP